jgi:hypothetical protein
MIVISTTFNGVFFLENGSKNHITLPYWEATMKMRQILEL